jgi:hypothetical protein
LASHPAGHPYSVGQVKAAFAAHGLTLRKAAKQDVHGVVVLRHGHVAVGVRVVNPRQTPTLYFTHTSKTHSSKRGNVFVLYPTAEKASVEAALARLG